MKMLIVVPPAQRGLLALRAGVITIAELSCPFSLLPLKMRGPGGVAYVPLFSFCPRLLCESPSEA